MPFYSYAGLKLFSAFQFAELVTVGKEFSSAPPDILFSCPDIPPPEVSDRDWVHHWRTDSGEVTLSLARTGHGFLLRFPFLADFLVRDSVGAIDAWPAPDTDESTLRHLLLDQVLPRLISHRGHLVLHASAVWIDRQAVAFAGQTGWGKSTLAASFHTAGFPLLSDDGLQVSVAQGQCMATALYPGLRLMPSAVAAVFPQPPLRSRMAQYTAKERIALEGPLASDPGTREDWQKEGMTSPLGALFVLGSPKANDPSNQISDSGAVGVASLSQRDACVELIQHSFQLDVSDAEAVARTFRVASAVAQELPVYHLTYPRDFTSLPEVRASILEVVSGLETTGVDQQEKE